MRTFSFVSTLLGMMLLVQALHADDEGGFTTWTSVSGAQMEARLVRVEGDSVILQTEDGREVAIRLDLLAQADQNRAREGAGEAGDAAVAGTVGVSGPAEGDAAEGGSEGDDAKGWLPVWRTGSYPEAFAVYEDPLFDFVILGNGAGRLFLKDDAGKVIHPAIWVGGFGLDYSKPKTIQRFGRAVVRVDTPNLRPVRNPATLVIAGTAEDNVKFERTYTYTPGSIKAEFKFDDPRNIEFPSMGVAGVRFNRGVSQGIKTDSDEAKAMFSQWTATAHHDGGRATFNYWQSMKRFPPKIRRVVATGPWGSREVTIAYLGVEAAGMVYAGMPLWSGYGFIARTGGPKSSDRRMGVQISVK